MNKKLLNPLKGALALLIISFNLFSHSISASDRPNVLMISVDDLNDWVGAFGGNPQCQTPHMDRFAEKSMVFLNTSCPGPVCGPSRSALLSGFMPATTGIYSNSNNMLDSPLVQSNTTLPEYFSKQDYLTISRGKIFHAHGSKKGIDIGHWAFDIFEQARSKIVIDAKQLNNRQKGIVHGKKLENPKFTRQGGSTFAFGPTVGGMDGLKDYETAKWFQKKLKEEFEKPFFMAVGISQPHLTWHVPQRFFDLYDLDTVQVPEYDLNDYKDILNTKGKTVDKPHDDFLWCQEYGLMKDAVRAYMAATSYADECVGMVLDSLANSKYADNTIVMIFGDHGWHLGEKLRFRKASLWREATQTPFIVHIPGMKKKQECKRNVNLIDIYPTLIDLCGLPTKELDGKSLKPLLENCDLPWSPTVTTQDKGNHSIISEKWHYIIRKKGTVEELYDLENDPMEFINLMQSNPEKVELAMKKLKPFLPKSNAEMVPRSNHDKSSKKLDATIKAKRDLALLK